ncbi:MAG TPA: glycine cleavage system protein GcvH [Roseiflexaceae bacterium]|nr:glycine cleavage system protein GcvH [Roseiflexaceae bacterium]
MANVPTDLQYTRSHEWIRIEGDVAVVGITEHAQRELGDVVFVELPEVGRTFEAEDAFGTVESVKAVSELFAPVAGSVTAVNQELEASPELINQDPYGDGWMIQIRLAQGAVGALMSAEAYAAFVAELEH